MRHVKRASMNREKTRLIALAAILFTGTMIYFNRASMDHDLVAELERKEQINAAASDRAVSGEADVLRRLSEDFCCGDVLGVVCGAVWCLRIED